MPCRTAVSSIRLSSGSIAGNDGQVYWKRCYCYYHPDEGRDPLRPWVPAFAGMDEKEVSATFSSKLGQPCCSQGSLAHHRPVFLPKAADCGFARAEGLRGGIVAAHHHHPAVVVIVAQCALHKAA